MHESTFGVAINSSIKHHEMFHHVRGKYKTKLLISFQHPNTCCGLTITNSQLLLLLNDAFGLMIIKEHDQTIESALNFTSPPEGKINFIYVLVRATLIWDLWVYRVRFDWTRVSQRCVFLRLWRHPRRPQEAMFSKKVVYFHSSLWASQCRSL